MILFTLVNWFLLNRPMMRNLLLSFCLSLIVIAATAQSNTDYLKANAVRVDNPFQLSDSVYNIFSPFQLFMVGEMHGTNESAQFVIGLANLFANKGDSISVGLEIP